MPAVKVPRKSTAIDMTAMCDVAFLLLTFFMLTSKFKPKDPVAVDIPQSTAQIPIPEKGIVALTVDKDGHVFMGVDDQKTRMEWLNQIATEYGVTFSPTAQQAFRLTDLFGMPVEAMNGFLELPNDKKEAYQQPGIPVDSVNGRCQLEDLIFLARRSGQMVQTEPFRIVIKSDKDSNFKVVDKVIKILQNNKNKVNKFNLITAAKNAPEGAGGNSGAH
jgi:biopolymer transport protein ExbD